jgi:hypothetical protein
MGVKNHTISFSSVQNPNSWDVQTDPMFEAFVQHPSAGNMQLDEMRFNAFQSGWLQCKMFYGIKD